MQRIHATKRAFAAILADGSVVTWGSPAYGGDSSAVQHRLRNVRQVQATKGAFAAILSDLSIVTGAKASLEVTALPSENSSGVSRSFRVQVEHLLQSLWMDQW